MAYGPMPYSENRGGRKGRTWWRGGTVQAILAGLATPSQTPGPFSAFQAGLGGSLAARQAEAEQQSQTEEDMLRRDLEQRLYDLKVRDIGAQEQQAQAALLRAQHEPQGSSAVSFQDWLTMPLEQRKQYQEFRNIADNPRVPDAFDRWLTMTPEQRAQYQEFRNVGDNPQDPLAETETIVLERDPITGYPVRTRTVRRRRSDLPPPPPIDTVPSHGSRTAPPLADPLGVR